MAAEHGVLILGATGRTGGHVLMELLARGLPVRAIVRSPDRLPAGAVGHPLLTVVTADLVALTQQQWQEYLADCDTVISCLGHPINIRGIFGPPRDLVTRAVRNVANAVGDRATPVRFILMTSVSVNQPDHADTRRGAGERALLWALRGIVPPSRDNQRAADVLASEVGPANPSLQWVVVRPDTLTEGQRTDYRVHDGITATLFRPDHTHMAAIAHFMGELTTDADTWQRWQGRMPVIADAAAPSPAA